jgi:ribosomal protein S18 acetylase RimI-like enzyme
MPIEVREAQPDEYGAIGDLTVAAYADVLPAEDAEYLDEIRDVARRAESCTILAAVDDGGALLGAVTYVPGPGTPYSESEAEGEAGFRMLAVSPTAQGRGVGRALVGSCVARARAQGARRLVLLTLPSMARAGRIYESFGFRRAPRRDWSPAPYITLKGYELDL